MSNPVPYVTARLHGGPHDGETRQLPWARIEIPVLTWEQQETSMYRLSSRWRGEPTADYEYVGPCVAEPEEAAA